MLVLGLTGGIGAGKSVVAQMFEKLGAKVLNADLMAKDITNTEPEVIQQIKAYFGEHIYSPGGLLRRKEMGQIVFSEPEKLKILNEIVHPPTILKIRSEIQHYKALKNYSLLIIESAIIFETGLETEFDRVAVVSADRARIAERLRQRDHLSQQEIESRIKSQLDPARKEELADIVIYNNSDIENLTQKVTKLFSDLIKMNPVNISEKLQV
jgi:dephospho-CoA kinase